MTDAPALKRVLFVDDEPRVLDGLRRSLRSKRKQWELVFVENGKAALKELGKAPFDVIVTDMRMPGMDGADLLLQAAALQPEAARIVLSGQTEEAAATRAATVAHRFLTKPCEPEVLEGTISRTLELRALLGSEELRQLVGGMAALPSLPSACMALNRALSDEHGSIAKVCAIVEKDVAMAVKVLQLVNSAFFGVPRRITSVEHAVSYLGLNTIKNLVLSHSLFAEFGAESLDNAERQQAHALLASRIARLLLPERQQAQVAATAALLHDAGSLALASRLPKQHRENTELAKREATPLYLVEKERFGVSHAEVGAYLLGLWGLPHDVIEAVAAHHAPWEEHQVLDPSAAVRVAIALAAELTGNNTPSAGADPPPEDAVARLGIAQKLEQIRCDLSDSLPKPTEPT
jgi:HD-like signal output (HDOD) protein/ActR/RegA family two-component response regulator